MKIEYNNLYTHFIFITLNRVSLIQEKHRVRIEKYITGIINNNNSKLYSIYANPEHVHFIISRSPKLSEEYLAAIIAESSERFINENELCTGKFKWQDSAAAFSVSKADVNKVCKYILNQPKHHHKKFSVVLRCSLRPLCNCYKSYTENTEEAQRATERITML